jgi:hypothetical protein
LTHRRFIVEQNVDSTEATQTGGDRRLDAGAVEQVKPGNHHVVALGEVSPVVRVAHGGDNVPPMIGEQRRCSFADAGAGACDENSLGHLGDLRGMRLAAI